MGIVCHHRKACHSFVRGRNIPITEGQYLAAVAGGSGIVTIYLFFVKLGMLTISYQIFFVTVICQTVLGLKLQMKASSVFLSLLPYYFYSFFSVPFCSPMPYACTSLDLIQVLVCNSSILPQ